jgi:hypothetical protein
MGTEAKTQSWLGPAATMTSALSSSDSTALLARCVPEMVTSVNLPLTVQADEQGVNNKCMCLLQDAADEGGAVGPKRAPPSREAPSRALLITGFIRPFTEKQAREKLSETGLPSYVLHCTWSCMFHFELLLKKAAALVA